MDLKVIQKHLVINLIDQPTRLSAACRIPNKNPDTIVKAILKVLIGVYGATEKFHTDNGCEFVNQSLIDLAHQFGICISTTAAYAPLANGTIERHNKVLGVMVEKVLADTKCHFDIALVWSLNAKNSLANVHGFSPFQLGLGRNPKLPNVLSDKPLH